VGYIVNSLVQKIKPKKVQLFYAAITALFMLLLQHAANAINAVVPT
jgi:hypothetical protein